MNKIRVYRNGYEEDVEPGKAGVLKEGESLRVPLMLADKAPVDTVSLADSVRRHSRTPFGDALRTALLRREE